MIDRCVRLGAASVAALAAFTSCAGHNGVETRPVAAEIFVSSHALDLQIGQQIQLFVIVLDQHGAQLDSAVVSFTSSDTAVVKVDAAGLVRAVGAGSASIEVKSGNASGSLSVAVTAPAGPPVATLSLTADSGVVTSIRQIQLIAVARDSAGTPLPGAPVTFTTLDPSIIDVSAAGVVSYRGVGTTFVRASSGSVSDSVMLTSVTYRVAVAGRAFGAAVSSGGAIFTTRLDEGLADRLAAGGTVLASVPAGGLPSSVTFNGAGTIAFVGSQTDHHVRAINVATNAVVDSVAIPSAWSVLSVAVVQGDSVLLVGTEGPLYVVRLPSLTLTDSVVTSGVANTLVIRGTRAYLNDVSGGRIHIVDWSARQVVDSIVVGGVPQGIAISSDGSRLYLANEVGQFQVWDLGTRLRGLSTSLPGGGGFSLAVNPANGLIYVGTSYFGRRVVVIDPATARIVRQLRLGGTVRRIAFASGGSFGVVANEGGWVDYIK